MAPSRHDAKTWEHAFLFSGLGALTWAIRGTDGWGGFDGAILPGMLWALLLYRYLEQRRMRAGWACFMFGLGISIGGMWGYGVYVPWIQGQFIVDAAVQFPISPVIGYWWLFVTGFAWGAPAGVLFCWVTWKTRLNGWLIRIITPALTCLLVIPVREFLPDALYPFFSTGAYEHACTSCSRALETTTVNFIVFLWLLGALLAEALLRNAASCKLVALAGVSFGVSFAATTSWCLLYGTSDFTDWWKAWELSMGFAGGMFTFWFAWQHESAARKEGKMAGAREGQGKNTSAFLFFMVALYGMTSRLGVVLGMYPDGFVQYDLPPQRVVLVVCLLVPFTAWFIIQARRSGFVHHGKEWWIHVAMFTCVVGITTIWPSNLVIVYVMLAWLAVAPMARKGQEIE